MTLLSPGSGYQQTFAEVWDGVSRPLALASPPVPEGAGLG